MSDPISHERMLDLVSAYFDLSPADQMLVYLFVCRRNTITANSAIFMDLVKQSLGTRGGVVEPEDSLQGGYFPL